LREERFTLRRVNWIRTFGTMNQTGPLLNITVAATPEGE